MNYYKQNPSETIAIHSNQKDAKVVKWVNFEQLSEMTTQARRIANAAENGTLAALYFDKNNKIRARYI